MHLIEEMLLSVSHHGWLMRDQRRCGYVHLSIYLTLYFLFDFFLDVFCECLALALIQAVIIEGVRLLDALRLESVRCG